MLPSPLSLSSVGQSKLVSQKNEISSTQPTELRRQFHHRRFIIPDFHSDTCINRLLNPFSMDILKTARCISTPFRPPPLIPHSRLANPLPQPRNFRKCRNMCAASNSDTILKSTDNTSKKEDDYADLKSWMDKNGLPPCKVMLNERPSHDSNYHSIHYVAASEDLQVSALHFLIALISVLQSN